MTFLQYKNIQLHYTSTGKGSVIILLHGFLENLSMWNEIVPELAKKNRVITIDLLGHGQTENLGYVHTMEDQATMVKFVIKSLGLRRVSLIGHSMGGYVALAFADLFPKNTKGFCLLNSTAYPDSEEKKTDRKRAIKVVKQNYKTFIRISIPMLFAKKNRVLLKKEIDQITKEALKTSKQGIIAALEGMKIRKDLTSVLHKNEFKKMLILGENDTVLNCEKHSKQVKNTNTEYHVLPHGHMSHVEATLGVVSKLKSFS
ncbi:MAG: alpha/beta fold hydrolase [Flavobacteriaceae bacterium]|nr:alpha/beta fold hydrolase [Flavobacteriaceae bacterium]